MPVRLAYCGSLNKWTFDKIDGLSGRLRGAGYGQFPPAESSGISSRLPASPSADGLSRMAGRYSSKLVGSCVFCWYQDLTSIAHNTDMTIWVSGECNTRTQRLCYLARTIPLGSQGAEDDRGKTNCISGSTTRASFTLAGIPEYSQATGRNQAQVTTVSRDNRVREERVKTTSVFSGIES